MSYTLDTLLRFTKFLALSFQPLSSLQGEIYTENSLVQQHTYQEIFEHHEVYFPSCTSCHRGHGSEMVEEDFLAQNFWKMDFVEIDESELA